MTKIASERDGGFCVATCAQRPQVCQIIPTALLSPCREGQYTRERILNAMVLLTGDLARRDEVAEYLRELMAAPHQSLVSNLVSLNLLLNSSWGCGEIAFKPLARPAHWPNTRMCVQVFLLPGYDNPISFQDGNRKFFEWGPLPSLRGCENVRSDRENAQSKPPWAFPLMGREPGGGLTAAFLRSGDIIVLTTPNAVTHPLPSEAALWLKWYFCRAGSMRIHGDDENGELDDDCSPYENPFAAELDAGLLELRLEEELARREARGEASPELLRTAAAAATAARTNNETSPSNWTYGMFQCNVHRSQWNSWKKGIGTMIRCHDCYCTSGIGLSMLLLSPSLQLHQVTPNCEI